MEKNFYCVNFQLGKTSLCMRLNYKYGGVLRLENNGVIRQVKPKICKR